MRVPTTNERLRARLEEGHGGSGVRRSQARVRVEVDVLGGAVAERVVLERREVAVGVLLRHEVARGVVDEGVVAPERVDDVRELAHLVIGVAGDIGPRAGLFWRSAPR